MRNFTLLIKPAGPDCNINCEYCFYKCKADRFGKSAHRMTDETLEKIIEEYMSVDIPVHGLTFQGGEPTLTGLDFYKRVVELEKKYARPHTQVANCLQTNALLMDDEWCRFLSEYNFLVGISLDGPKIYHDRFRRDSALNGTFDKVMKAIECCKKHNVEFNILTLINSQNVRAVDELFDFFAGNDFKFLQFIPCAEHNPDTGKMADYSITPKQYGDFLCRLFDKWYEYGPDKISIRLFDSILSQCVTGRHTMCTFLQRCDDYIVVEHNGDVFCCDFFVTDEWKIGNVMETPIDKLAGDKIKRDFSSKKRKINNKCLVCRHLDVCRGGCLKDRLLLNSDYGDVSYFCDAYKQFYDYTIPKFRQLAANKGLLPQRTQR